MDHIIERFKIANYISVCEMYLKNYTDFELRKYSCGHFGTSPAINFIYAHLNDFYRRNGLTHKEIIGTGHSGAALLANLYLDGLLYKQNPKYSVDEKGFNELLNDFGGIIRTEINPFYPNTIYDGGELGYSLSNAYGYAIESDKDIVTCIIGDGEAETGTISSSWFLNRILDTKAKVLPILNLNGYKMGSKSILSMMSNDELFMYFNGLGYSPIFVSENHEIMKNALESSLLLSKPLIILSTRKGWTGLSNNDVQIEGNIISHKDPLAKFSLDEKRILVKEWLDTYGVKLFDKKFYDIIKLEDKDIETYVPSSFDVKKEYYSKSSNMEALNEFLNYTNIKVFSPDEINSNKLYVSNVIEMLSETTLNGLYQGYTHNNKGLYIGYEAFMPIIGSMVSQYLKYIKQSIFFEKTVGSMTYILTSTCWENTYSHQNPEFVDSVLLKEYDYANVYFPKDGHSLVECTKMSLNTTNAVNIIVSSKGNIRQYNTPYKDIEVIKEGTDGVLIATGDYMLSNILKTYDKLKEKGINMRVIYVARPKVLEEIKDYSSYFIEGKPNIYCYHGYAKTIKALLYNCDVDVDVYGYEDKTFESGYVLEKLREHQMDSDSLVKKLVR